MWLLGDIPLFLERCLAGGNHLNHELHHHPSSSNNFTYKNSPSTTRLFALKTPTVWSIMPRPINRHCQSSFHSSKTCVGAVCNTTSTKRTSRQIRSTKTAVYEARHPQTINHRAPRFKPVHNLIFYPTPKNYPVNCAVGLAEPRGR